MFSLVGLIDVILRWCTFLPASRLSSYNCRWCFYEITWRLLSPINTPPEGINLHYGCIYLLTCILIMLCLQGNCKKWVNTHTELFVGMWESAQVVTRITILCFEVCGMIITMDLDRNLRSFHWNLSSEQLDLHVAFGQNQLGWSLPRYFGIKPIDILTKIYLYQ